MFLPAVAPYTTVRPVMQDPIYLQGSPQAGALFEGRCLTPDPEPLITSWKKDIGPACTNFTEWQVRDGALSAEPSPSSWYFCSDVDSAIYCEELAEAEERSGMRKGSLVSRAVRQAGYIYSNYIEDNVEGTTLVYTAAASYSTQQQEWLDYTLEVSLIAFGDDWVGVSFRYIDDENYYRFEMNSQERIRRLKKVTNGAVKILWTQPGLKSSTGYTPGTIFTVRVMLQGPEIRVSLKEGMHEAHKWELLTSVLDNTYALGDYGAKINSCAQRISEQAGTVNTSSNTLVYNCTSNSSDGLIRRPVGGRSPATFGLWTASSPSVYFVNVKLYRDYSVAKHSNAAVMSSGHITLRGAGFGALDSSLRVSVGSTNCQMTSWMSASSTKCHSTPGYSRSMYVKITVGQHVGSLSDGFSVDVPSLMAGYPRKNTPGTGSAQVTVRGANFGTVGRTQVFRSAHSAAEVTTWLSTEQLPCRGCYARSWGSDTQIQALAPSGVSGTHRVAITAGQVVGSTTLICSIDSATISTGRRSNVAGTGSLSMTVHASSMGFATYSSRFRHGDTGCESTEWVSESSVRGLVGRGAQGTRRISMTVGNRVGSVSSVLSVDSVYLCAANNASNSSTHSANHASTGSASITVHGSDLGQFFLTPMLRAGMSACESTEWGSETAVRCRIGRGSLGTLRNTMTTGQRSGSISQVWSWDGPVMSGLGVMSSSVTADSINVTAFEMFRVNLSTAEHGCNGSWCDSPCVEDCVTHYVHDRPVYAGCLYRCLVSPLRLDNIIGSWPFGSWPMNLGSTGSVSLTVIGSSLGLSGSSAAVRSSWTAAEFSAWTSTTSMVCQAASGLKGTARAAAMTVGKRTASLTQAYMIELLSFNAVTLSTVHRANLAGTGSAIVTVHGAGMGLVLFTAMGRVGQTGCEATDWDSDTSMRCKLARGIQQSRRSVVTAGKCLSTRSMGFSMDAAYFGSGSNLGGSIADGKAYVSLFGGRFSTFAFSSAVRQGFSGCESTLWESESSMRCLAGMGVGATRQLMITAGHLHSLTSGFSMDIASLSAARRHNFAGTGSSSVTVHGTGLGLLSFTAMVRGGQTGCEGSEWESETSVRCLASIGSKKSRRFVMTAGVRAGSVSEAWSYDSPARMSLITASNVVGTGGTSVTVYGRSIGGTKGFSHKSRAGHTACEGTEWQSDTSIACLVGHSLAGTRRMAMTVGDQSGSISEI